MKFSERDFAKLFDSTLLKPETSWDEILNFVDESIKYDVRAIAIPWYALTYAIKKVSTTDIGIVVGIDFPFGYSSIERKLDEIKFYLSFSEKITDFDVVVNISAVRSNNWEYVQEELRILSQEIKKHDKICKIIIETSRLSDNEIVRLCQLISNESSIDYVKTGTGFGPAPTTYKDVQLMKKYLGGKKIKVSGGIKTLDQVKRFLDMGVSLFGSSAAIEIINEFVERYRRK
ncbi:deoxyribose-phosphate aldolase [Pseudothermotoga elfii]